MLLRENSDSIINILHEMIFSYKNINYINYTSSMENDLISIYYSPEIKDRMILLNTIITCLDAYNYSNDKLMQITKNIIDVYSNTNIIYLENAKYDIKNILTHDEALFKNENIKTIINKLTFLDDAMMNKIIDHYTNGIKLTDEEYILFELQVFTFASVFMDMDKLLDKVIDFLDKSIA